MTPELVSFRLCPFVQRCLVTLLHKDVEHRIRYIDLTDPPDWFVQISPLGKVPLLRFGDTVLFESAVINEYLDETTGERLMPDDPLTRARHRGWIEFGSELLVDQWRTLTAEAGDDHARARASLREKLAVLERQLGDGPWFDTQFSLVDTAYAPFFMRHVLLDGPLSLATEDEFPKCGRWGAALLALPAVTESVVEDFEALFRAHVRDAGGYAAQRIALA